MKKILILLIGIVVISAASICNASWWYDFIHSDGGDDGSDSNTCWTCGGTGNCSTCNGTGYVEEYDSDSESYVNEYCSDCGGSGNCSDCGGSGYN